VPGVTERELADAAQLASLADETPEGRSIVVLAKEKYGIRGRDCERKPKFIPFTAQTRMSGVDLDGVVVRKGAVDADLALSARRRRRRRCRCPRDQRHRSIASPNPAARRWRSPTDGRLLGVIHLKDIVKGGIRERFANCAAWASAP
jgi:potassium-transporting ATPase ATP-binding subunit